MPTRIKLQAPARFWRRFNSNAILYGANLSNANLWKANLTNPDLREANLDKSILLGADLTTAKVLTDSQLTDALLCGTKLPHPTPINLDPDRDCDNEQLAQILVEQFEINSLEEAEEYIDHLRNEQ